MFSPSGNNNNSNSYHHQLPLSFYQHSSTMHPVISHDTDRNNILYHYYQHPLLSGQHLLPGYAVPESTNVPNIAAINNSINASASGVVATNALPEKPAKKDRHSKIYTAQGLRDRRVRLSTEISRQFFDLQDLLGYDKASETIAWLLSKSKEDIKELVEMKRKSSSDVAGNCEQDGIVSQNETLIGTSKERKMKSKRAAALREETRITKAREKMCSAEKIYELNKARFTSQFGGFGGKSTEPIAHNYFPRDDMMEESIMITRKLKPSNLGYQHSFSCMPENWDMNGNTLTSSCDATPSMNLSTELLISGKAWEACSNECLE